MSILTVKGGTNVPSPKNQRNQQSKLKRQRKPPNPNQWLPIPQPKHQEPSLCPPPVTPTKLDFWQAFKPYIDQMRHTELSKVKIKDEDCLDAKPTVITGVYNSILMRVSKKLLRLELYIDTETRKRNLQILDYIKSKIKVPPALKGRIKYERKKGRRAKRVCVTFPGFELSDRSCWPKYISEIISVADDFFNAVEKPMRDLV